MIILDLKHPLKLLYRNLSWFEFVYIWLEGVVSYRLWWGLDQTREEAIKILYRQFFGEDVLDHYELVSSNAVLY